MVLFVVPSKRGRKCTLTLVFGSIIIFFMLLQALVHIRLNETTFQSGLYHADSNTTTSNSIVQGEQTNSQSLLSPRKYTKGKQADSQLEAPTSATKTNSNATKVEWKLTIDQARKTSSVDYFACCGAGHRYVSISVHLS